MALKEYKMLGYKGRELTVYESEVVGAKNIVVLIHGMQEHAKRYEWFSGELEYNGIAFFAADLRGHGKNITLKPGLDDGNIFANIVEDYLIFIENLKKKYVGAKIILMGHSFGSFVAQRFVRDFQDKVDKIILCGSNFMNNFLMKAAGVVASINKLLTGRKKDAKLLESLSIRSYGKGYPDGNWLTRDENIWAEYKKDPLCGQVFPVAFYHSMSKEVVKNYKGLKRWNNLAEKKVPIFIIAGDDDPVGEKGKGVTRLYEEYDKNDLIVDIKLYDGARHELLNELNKKEVVQDILNFIRK